MNLITITTAILLSNQILADTQKTDILKILSNEWLVISYEYVSDESNELFPLDSCTSFNFKRNPESLTTNYFTKRTILLNHLMFSMLQGNITRIEEDVYQITVKSINIYPKKCSTNNIWFTDVDYREILNIYIKLIDSDYENWMVFLNQNFSVLYSNFNYLNLMITERLWILVSNQHTMEIDLVGGILHRLEQKGFNTDAFITNSSTDCNRRRQECYQAFIKENVHLSTDTDDDSPREERKTINLAININHLLFIYITTFLLATALFLQAFLY